MNDRSPTQPQGCIQNKPPKRCRSPNVGSFKKGRSGNPKGRPRGTGKHAAGGSTYQVLLDKTVTATIGGKVREMSMEEAIQHRTFKDALAGKAKAIRQVLEWIREREAWLRQRRPVQSSRPTAMREFSPDPDNADQALMILGIVRIDQYRASWNKLERTPLLIEPWAVELALRRNRGGAGFDEGDWAEIKRCTQELGAQMLPASQASGEPHGRP